VIYFKLRRKKNKQRPGRLRLACFALKLIMIVKWLPFVLGRFDQGQKENCAAKKEAALKLIMIVTRRSHTNIMTRRKLL
jgi:hypothetical protein